MVGFVGMWWDLVGFVFSSIFAMTCMDVSATGFVFRVSRRFPVSHWFPVAFWGWDRKLGSQLALIEIQIRDPRFRFSFS